AMQMTGKLSAKKIPNGGVEIDLGVISNNCVTDAGVAYLVDSFQDSSSGTGDPMDLFYWHGYGTSSGAETTGDTALTTEIGTRSSGTQIEGATANIYRTVATRTATGTHAIKEHGLFSSSDSDTLWDRSVFDVINVSSGDSIEFTYELTVTPGG
ncbi:unnamed protein product, partial [marine sediment metagenome]